MLNLPSFVEINRFLRNTQMEMYRQSIESTKIYLELDKDKWIISQGLPKSNDNFYTEIDLDTEAPKEELNILVERMLESASDHIEDLTHE